MKKKQTGTTIVELLVYTSVLTFALTLIYGFYIQVSSQRALQVTETEIYTNGYRVLLDFQQTIKNASSLDYPALGQEDQSLSLNGGLITYQLNAQNQLEKTVAGETSVVIDQNVVIDSLNFAVFGPNVNTPTVKINFTLKGNRLIEGRERKEAFQTGVTLE